MQTTACTLPLCTFARAAVTFNGGVILAADSRTSTGNYIANRVTDKVGRFRLAVAGLQGELPLQLTKPASTSQSA